MSLQRLTFVNNPFCQLFSVLSISKYGISRKFRFNNEALFRFLNNVQASFPPQTCFHNDIHTADILQCLYFLLSKGRISSVLQEIEIFALFFSGVVCHYGHPGVTSNFLINVRHPRAIRYNDFSVLQNYSLATIFTFLSQPEYNFLGELNSLFSALRQTIVENVVNLDIAKASVELSRFRTRIAAEFALDVPENKQLLLATCLRFADLSFPARVQPVYMKWMDRMMEEFFIQGDIEKQLGAPISPFCDRDLTDIYKCQLAFLDVAVEPLLSAFIVAFAPHLNKDLMEHGLDANKRYLQSKIEGFME